MRPSKMIHALLLAVLLCGASGWAAPEEKEEEPKLLGRITPGQLAGEPYSEWFEERYAEYEPNDDVMARLRSADRDGVDLKVFFGTWCPDSQREVPRLLKLLDELEFPSGDLTLVAVDHVDGAQKTSPTGEEKGLEVYKVPTVVVSREGREVARLVEHPVLSLERDLLAILSGEPYRPAYLSYPTVRRWLREGLLRDENVSPAGLAGQVRGEVRSVKELAAAGSVLLSRGQVAEAVQLFRVNGALYPGSPWAFAWLARGLRRQGEDEEARTMERRALKLAFDLNDPEQLEKLVELLEDEEP